MPYVKHIVEVLRQWYPDEYEVLTTLAKGNVAEFAEFARELPEVVQHLRAYNLVARDEPRIEIAIVAAYLASRSEAPAAGQSAFATTSAKGDPEWLQLVLDISAMRNRLEPRLRRFIRTVLMVRHGPDRWIDPLFASLPAERRSKLLGVDRDEILNKNLLLQDLLQIMESNWESFKQLEATAPANRVTKAQLTVLLSFINAQRADAHAKDTSSPEVVAVALACAALSRGLDPYLSG
jgi:hypothetical protein